jgi:uridine monophosphate synthetase
MNNVSEKTKQAVALSLHTYGILQFGEFTLKSGIVAPFYVDLRMLQSHPDALHAVAKIYSEMLVGLPQDVFLAGIPEAGIPLATAVGYEANRPLIQPRAKVKDHGMGKSIEGDWKAGDKVAIIDDLVTKGDSKIESLEVFKACDLKVVGFYLLLDREMGGKELVEKAGYSMDIAMTMSEVFSILAKAGKITTAQCEQMIRFMHQN